MTEPEDVLDPGLEIVDPHHHLWERPPRRYLLHELLADLSQGGHNIVQSVYIQCHSMYRAEGPADMKVIGETEFINGVAAMSASGLYGPTRLCAGIVGYTDLRLGDSVREVLQGHVAAGNGRFRGIRQGMAWDASDAIHRPTTKPPRHLVFDPAFRKGFGHLQQLGLSFDAWLNHPQIPDLVDLARGFPGTTIIANHVGGLLGIGPYAGPETFDLWKGQITLLATCPNVLMKIGGLGMDTRGFVYAATDRPPNSTELAEAWRPYVETCIAAFGVERCMFESNFPVDKETCDYRTLWNAFKRLTKDYAATEKAALFHGTARRAYRL